MRPKFHIITSGFAVLLCAYYAGLPASDTTAWLAVACVATVLIDLDHFLLQLMMGDRRQTVLDMLSHPLRHTRSKEIVKRLHYPGFGILRLEAHLMETSAATIILHYYSLPYNVPILVSLWVHCAVDFIQVAVSPKSR